MREIDELTKQYESKVKRIRNGRYLVLPIEVKTLSYENMLREKKTKRCAIFRLVEEVERRTIKKAIVKDSSHKWFNQVVGTYKEYESGIINIRLNGKRDAIHKKFLEFIV